MTDLKEAFKRIDEYIELKMKEDRIPGVAVALTDRERTLRVAGYGYANLDAQIPVTGDTLFELASIGKSFVSVGLLQEYDAGRLDFHKPVSEYLPWFEVKTKYEPITVHHLLSHTAGIIDAADVATASNGLHAAWALRHTNTAWPPGSTYYYSNVGFKALAVLLENLAGRPLREVLQSRILDPLGMSSTHAAITQDSQRDKAIGYRPFYDDRPPHHNQSLRPGPWYEYAGGDGSVAATARDMANYVRMFLNRGQGPQGRIISEGAFDLMTQKVIPEGRPEIGPRYYGYGSFVSDVDGHRYVGHDGDSYGYVATIEADMNHGFGAAVLMNGTGWLYHAAVTRGVARFAFRVLAATMNHEGLPPIPSVVDPTKVEDAEEYAGVYRSGDRRLTLVAEAGTLALDHGGERVVLERRGTDTFYVLHQDFELFLLEFGRSDGEVVEAFHGNDWFVNDSYSGPSSFDYPEEWEAYVGHYRSSSHWFPSLRVLLRKGTLYVPEMGASLSPLGEGLFGSGQSPERLRFDTIVDGKALRVNVSGGDFYRAFTP